MKPSSTIFVIKRESLELFDCANLWKPRKDGNYQLTLTYNGAIPYLNKYHIKRRHLAGHSIDELVLNNVVIGFAQDF